MRVSLVGSRPERVCRDAWSVSEYMMSGEKKHGGSLKRPIVHYRSFLFLSILHYLESTHFFKNLYLDFISIKPKMYIKSTLAKPPLTPPEGGEKSPPLFLPLVKIGAYTLSDKTKISLKTQVFRSIKGLLPNEHGE